MFWLVKNIILNNFLWYLNKQLLFKRFLFSFSLITVSMLTVSCFHNNRSQEDGAPAYSHIRSGANRPCITPIGGSSVTVHQSEPASTSVIEKDKELYRPMSELETKHMLKVLRKIRIDKNGIKFGSKHYNLTKQRFMVLRQDILSGLARFNIGESIKRLQTMPNPDQAAIAWAGTVSRAMDICARDRYMGLDGEPGVMLEQVDRLILNLRPQFESIFGEYILPRDLTGHGSYISRGGHQR